MAPAQLAHDMVSIVKEIADFHRMVTTWNKKKKKEEKKTKTNNDKSKES
jgi:hypothetical protein